VLRSNDFVLIRKHNSISESVQIPVAHIKMSRSGAYPIPVPELITIYQQFNTCIYSINNDFLHNKLVVLTIVITKGPAPDATKKM
jgi:hypothetical protein